MIYYYKYFVLFSVLQTFTSALSQGDCWWTGCQSNLWAVTGCGQYNRTQGNVRQCEGGSEYYCCPIAEKKPIVTTTGDCWWTGCQSSTWAVTGCGQYNRTQENVKECDGGSEYYCCPIVEKKPVVAPTDDCWWTGCQANSWAVKGCQSYNRTEKDKMTCGDDSFKYQCCAISSTTMKMQSDFPEENCWWSGCQPNGWKHRGCPSNTIQVRSESCTDGDLFQCCVNNESSFPGVDNSDVETLTGTSFTDFVKYLLLKSNNFTIKPDKLKCNLIDVDKSHVFRIKNEGIRICDLCPNFPQQRYQNVYLDKDPAEFHRNINFPECFGRCFQTHSCMAYSYDHASKKCYMFNSTEGNFEEEAQWTTVFMTQPTGVLFDWMYSRHTLAVGTDVLSRQQENSFLSCLNKCNAQTNCNILSYSLIDSMCTTYQDIENHLERVDFEYGHLSAFRMTILPAGQNKRWRFLEIGEDNLLSLKSTKISSGPCRTTKNETHNSFYSKPCLTTPSVGCDASTGCKLCYYPEKTTIPENLSVCPDSDLYYMEKIKKMVGTEMKKCLQNTDCMGFGLDSERTEVITLNNFGQHQYSKSFMLKYPKTRSTGVHMYLNKYEFIENLSIEPISNEANTLQTLYEVNFDKCAMNYEKSNYKRMSYFKKERKCILSSEFVRLKETKNVFTLFKKPSFLSPLLNFVRTPGLSLDSTFSVKSQQIDCRTNCEESCAQICNQPTNDWCAYVSIEYFDGYSKCHFFDVNEKNLKLIPSTNSMILVAQSKSNFTLVSLDQVNPFNEDENMILECFSSTNEQTQTSLTVYGSSNQTTSVAIRSKRGFFDWIGKAVKKVGETVVNAVKDTVNQVVDTAKGVVTAVDKVVKGDLDGAKNAITEIPIVKDVKNAVEFGGAVISGDWDTAKEKGLDLLGSSIVDVGLTVVAPGVGKVIGTGLKSIAKGSKTAIKGMKNQAKDARNKIQPKNNNNDKKKQNNKDKEKDKDKDKEKDNENNNDTCERRTKRGISRNSKGKKKACNQIECDAPKSVRFSLKSTFQNCNRKSVGSQCTYECKVGYEEKGPRLTCAKRNNNGAWNPQPECTLYQCNGGPYPIIAVKTPKIDSLTSISTTSYIVVYVVMYDKNRKLPVWSIALHQSNDFQSKSYNDAKNFGRKSFFKYPCTALLQHQAVGKNYVRSGWDQGHLTPANIARWSEKAAKSSFAFINIAPQEPYVNEHPWQKLESHVECFSKRRRTLVVTGICKKSLGKKIGQNIDVPACFWKMICYKDEKSIEQVVGFKADNSPIIPGKLDERETDIFTPISQAEINKLYDSTLGNPWIRGATVTAGREIGINPDFNDNSMNSGTIWLPVNINDCMRATALSDFEKDEWKDSLMSKKRKRGRRDVSGQFLRGCTPSELKEQEEFFDLLKKSQGAANVDTETDDDDSESADEESPSGDVEVSVQKCGKRIIGYYTSWGLKKINSQILSKLTHVVYAFLEMRSDGTVDLGSPDKAHSSDVVKDTETSRERLEHLLNLAKFYPHVKIMFAVGGWENSQYFSKIAASSESRVKFIASIIRLIEKYGFDGVDIDWEYPVTGGAVEGVPQDKSNYVLLMKDLRQALDVFASDVGRKNKFLISFAGAAGQWTLDPGFDLPGLLEYADFVNVMTYDFFGAWASKWGAYTGPPAPLHFGMPPRFSGKTNVDWTIKYYTCKSKLPHKINMGVPFYGRFWNNVGDSVDGKDQMWRTANAVNGAFQGGYTPWFKIQQDHLSDTQFEQSFHEKSKSPYAWNAATKVFLGYENEKSLGYKVKYATDKNVGGLMIWSVDLDDDDLTLLNTVFKAPLCEKTDPKDVNHKCSPIDEKRWWTSEDGDDMAGLCGRSAPLYKGYYPVCDPDDPGYSCCGPSGYCGSGEKYCECPTCKDYGNNPEKILDAPVKPTVPVTWYFLNAKEGLRGRCGRKVPKIDGVFPTCNPDDENAYCCSNGDYCGKGKEFCECQSCINFKKSPSYRFGPKKWWTLEDGEKRAGTCGPKADKVDGVYEAECEPNTNFSCCSPNGYCGSGPDYCDCKGCKRF